MDPIIKNVHRLSSLLSNEDLEKLNAGALQHRKFSRITFKILAVTDEVIKVQTVQGKTPHENFANEATLIERTKQLFGRFFPDRKIIVNATEYKERGTEQVTPAYIRNRMTELNVKVKDIVADTGLEQSNISAWINDNREMSQIAKAMFFYYFEVKRSQQPI